MQCMPDYDWPFMLSKMSLLVFVVTYMYMYMLHQYCITLICFFLGLQINIGYTVITVRTTLLMCSVDLPARCLCSNMKQFNGKYACIYCENPGTQRPSCKSARDWLPGEYRLRTHQSIVENTRMAVQDGDVVCMCRSYFRMVQYAH